MSYNAAICSCDKPYCNLTCPQEAWAPQGHQLLTSHFGPKYFILTLPFQYETGHLSLYVVSRQNITYVLCNIARAPSDGKRHIMRRWGMRLSDCSATCSSSGFPLSVPPATFDMRWSLHSTADYMTTATRCTVCVCHPDPRDSVLSASGHKNVCSILASFSLGGAKIPHHQFWQVSTFDTRYCVNFAHGQTTGMSLSVFSGISLTIRTTIFVTSKYIRRAKNTVKHHTLSNHQESCVHQSIYVEYLLFGGQ